MRLSEAGAKGILDRVLKRFSQYSDQPVDKAVAEWALLAKESLFNNPNDYHPSGNALLTTNAQSKVFGRPFPASGFGNASQTGGSQTTRPSNSTGTVVITENKDPAI